MSDEILDLIRQDTDEIAKILAPDVYGSESQDMFIHWSDAEGRYLLHNEKQLRRYLISLGLEGMKPRNEDRNSEVSEVIARADSELRVNYIGKIACLPLGLVETGGLRFYNIDTGERSTQIVTELPPTIFLVGKSSREAAILIRWLTEFLGGHSINPLPFLNSISSPNSATLAGATHWVVESLPSPKVLHRLLTVEKLPFGKFNDVFLPFVSQRTVFIRDTAEALKGLSFLQSWKGSVCILYLPPDSLEKTKSEIVSFYKQLREGTFRGYIAPEVTQKLFDASVAGEAYQILRRTMPSGSAIASEGEVVTYLEGSSRHFQNRMNRERATTRTLLEAISQQYPAEVQPISSTHWRFNLPKHDNEQQPQSSIDNN